MSLLNIMILFILSSAVFLVALEDQRSQNEMKSRAQTYLCSKDLIKKTNSYLTNMSHFNKAIVGSEVLNIIPGIGILTRKVSKESLQLAQQAYHTSYLYRVISSNSCHTFQGLFFLSKGPYKTTIYQKIVRDLAGRAMLKGEKWSSQILNQKWGRTIFVLNISYFLKSSISSYFTTNVKETEIKASSILNSFLEYLSSAS